MENSVGTVGEKIVAVWCAQAGLTAHRPDHDSFGWDYLIEYPNTFTSYQRLLDSVPAPVEFRVQVKSTNGTDTSVAVSLSHMLRLASLKMPVFFCFVVFGSQPEPTRAYLVHLGEDLIARTLARVRELSASGDRELHRRTISVGFNSSHEIAQPFWKGFKCCVDTHLTDGIETYIAWKNSIVSSVGFDEGRVTANITFEPMVPDDFFDFFLDLKDSLDVHQMVVREHRFGIPEEIEPSRLGPAKLSIDHAPRTDCVVSLRKDAFSASVEFPAKWYAPPPPMWEDKDHLKFRIVTPTFELLMWPFAQRMNFHGKTAADKRYPLKDLRDFSNAMHLLGDPTIGPCLFELRLADQPVYTGSMKINKSGDDWSEIRQVVASAWELADRAGVSSSTHASLTELMRGKDATLALHGLMRGANARIQFSDPAYFFPNQKTGFVKVFCTAVGNFRVAGVFAVVGTSCIDESAFSLTTRDVRFIRIYGEALSDEWNQEIEVELLKVASDTLQADGIMPVAA